MCTSSVTMVYQWLAIVYESHSNRLQPLWYNITKKGNEIVNHQTIVELFFPNREGSLLLLDLHHFYDTSAGRSDAFDIFWPVPSSAGLARIFRSLASGSCYPSRTPVNTQARAVWELGWQVTFKWKMPAIAFWHSVWPIGPCFLKVLTFPPGFAQET